MTCRIGADSGAVARLIVKLRPAQGQHTDRDVVRLPPPEGEA
jgi:hypothetical protein